jgi:hypothetical protein
LAEVFTMRFPVAFGWLVLGACVPALACGTSNSGGAGGGGGAGGTSGSADSGGGDVSKGVQPGEGGVAAQDLNPYGVAYPKDNIGTSARMGSSAGNQIQNFCFVGYVNAAPGTPTSDTAAPTTICLADYYDPLNKKYKLLHISVAAEWCNPCNEETDSIAGDSDAGPPVAKTLASQGVVLLQALTEGYTVGTAAVLGDLKTWISNKGIDYNIVLDPELANLGVFVTEAAIPWNSDIDVRTMELLDQGVGYDGMIESDIEGQLTWVENNAPSYACPSGEKLSGKSCVAE